MFIEVSESFKQCFICIDFVVDALSCNVYDPIWEGDSKIVTY